MIAEFLVLLGSFVLFSGALGVVLFKDSYQRFHAAGKVSLFGLALILFADFIRSLGSAAGPAPALLIGPLIVILVGPVASHVLARSLYFSDLKSSKKQ